MNAHRTVLIVLPYINHYRLPLLRSLMRRLAARGVDLEVASAQPSGQDIMRSDAAEALGPVMRQTSLKLLRRQILIRSLPKRWLTRDLVVIEHAVKNLESYLILTLRKAVRRPTAIWGHGHTITEKRSRLTVALQKWMIHRADWYFAYTPGSAQRALSNGMNPARVSVLNNTTDTRALRAEWARTSSNSRRAHTFLYVGGIDASKRIDRLLRVAEQAYAADSRFRLIVGGRGKDEHLLSRSEAPWLDYRGAMNLEQKAAAGREASAMIIAGRVGLAVVDAFAMQLPVITSEWDYHAPEFEYLNADNAIITPDDESSLVAAICRIMDSSNLRSSLAAGSARSADTLTIANMVRAFEDGIIGALD